MNYLVNDVYPCIQGEGVLTGVAMIMLRLHGCDVGCPFCDTKQTWYKETKNKRGDIEAVLGENPLYVEKHQSEIVAFLKMKYPNMKWVLISGGEPARFELKPLVNALHDAGYKVAIETSGTELGHIGANIDWICVSPKLNMPGGKKVLSDALQVADEIKHVIGKQEHITELENLIKTNPLKEGVEICVQPISQSKKATELCIKVAQDKGWRLSIQVHKYLSIP